jgi:hypothetical protein
MVITDSCLLGAIGYVGDPVSLCLHEDGMLCQTILLCSPQRLDVTEYGSLDVGAFVNQVTDFFCKGKILCEGVPKEVPADLSCLPRAVRMHCFPLTHLRSVSCPVWFQPLAGSKSRVCLHCRRGVAAMRRRIKRAMARGAAATGKTSSRDLLSNKKSFASSSNLLSSLLPAKTSKAKRRKTATVTNTDNDPGLASAHTTGMDAADGNATDGDIATTGTEVEKDVNMLETAVKDDIDKGDQAVDNGEESIADGEESTQSGEQSINNGEQSIYSAEQSSSPRCSSTPARCSSTPARCSSTPAQCSSTPWLPVEHTHTHDTAAEEASSSLQTDEDSMADVDLKYEIKIEWD